MNHCKRRVAGKLTLVNFSRLMASPTAPSNEHAGGCPERLQRSDSARGHLIAFKTKDAKEGYLENCIRDTIMKQKAYETLASF